MRNTVAAIGLLALLTGCSVAKDIPRVNAAIGDFHHDLNAQQFDRIYANAGPEFKAGGAPADMLKLFAAIHRKLGNFQSGSATGWNDNINTGGHYVTVNYKAKYAGGDADEFFLYRIDGERAALAGYRINSMALVVN